MLSPSVDAQDAGLHEALEPEDRGLVHVNGLDGLRGLAVLAVMGYHLGFSWLRGGYLGVDLFFVLSGYLITGLLLHESSYGRVDLGRFYARRVRRLFPAMALLLVVFSAVAFTSQPVARSGLRSDGLSTLFSVANWHFIRSGTSYFAQFNAPSPLRHTWSLAVEDQFYLIWPLIIACVVSPLARRRGAMTAVIAGLAVASFAASLALYEPGQDPSRVYFGTDSRAFTLLLGALLAIVARGKRYGPGRVNRHVAWTVLGPPALLVMAVMFVRTGDRDEWMYQGGLLFFAVVAVVVIGGVHGGVLGRMFSVRPLRWVGSISYGLYLWHWPLNIWLTPSLVHTQGWRLDVVRILATFAVASASFVLLERPVRQCLIPARRSPRLVFSFSFAGLVVLILLSTLGAKPVPEYLTTGSTAPRDLEVREPSVKRTTTTAATTTAPPTVPTTLFAAVNPSLPGSVPPTSPTSVATTTLPALPVRHPTRVLLLGDSVAASVQEALGDEMTGAGVAYANGSVPGCGIILGAPTDPETRLPVPIQCESGIARFQANNLRDVKPDLVVLLSVWEAEDRIIDGQYYEAGTPGWTTQLLKLFEATLARSLDTGAKIVIVLPADPVAGDEGASKVVDRTRRIKFLRGVLNTLAQRHRGDVATVDLAPIVCGATPCEPMRDGIELRTIDGVHFDTLAGQRWVAARLSPLIAQLDLNALPRS